MDDIEKSDIILAIGRLRNSLNPDKSDSDIVLLNGMIKTVISVLDSVVKEGRKGLNQFVNDVILTGEELQEKVKNAKGEL